MELSTETMQILKNFASINSNFVIKPGNTLMTVAEAKNILCSANVDESFEKITGIYDLNEFLNVLNLVDKPNVYFTDQYARVCDSTGRAEVKYYYSDPDMLTYPSKVISMPSAEVKFTLDQSTLNNIKRAAAALGHSELAIEPSEGCISLTVMDQENSTSNTYSIEIDGEYDPSAEFKFILSISNLKMIPSDYEVGISSSLISQFSSTEMDLTYWVALEKSSTYS